MAALVDTKFEKGAGGQVSPFSFVSNAGTVAGSIAANSNRVLIASAEFAEVVMASITPVTMTWDGVPMTAITSLNLPDLSGCIFFFGLIAPNTGAKTLSVAWTSGAGNTVCLSAVSCYNADQATGWNNATSASGTSNSATVSVTTTSGDLAVAVRSDDNAIGGGTVTVGTNAWEELTLNNNYGAAYNAAVGASTTITWSLGSSVAWAIAAVNVIQAAAASSSVGGVRTGIVSTPGRGWG